MRIVKRKDGFWVVDTPEGIEEAGPYRYKGRREDGDGAQDGLQQIKRFLKCEQKPRQFFTTEQITK